jgi:hypothetical protein
MNTTSFVKTRKNKIASFRTAVTVERTPATLSEHRARRGRWFDFVGDYVTECFKVKVTFTTIDHTTFRDGETHPSGGSVHTDEYFEIVTPFGRGCVVPFQSGDELECFIPSSGKTLITGCWKKYGQYRGHSVAYLAANQLSVNSKSKVDHTCCVRIYDAARGVKREV